jgi:hypothetical protein
MWGGLYLWLDLGIDKEQILKVLGRNNEASGSFCTVGISVANCGLGERD